MKKDFSGLLSANLLMLTLLSCAKTATVSGSSSLTIVNAVAGSNPVAVNFSNDPALSWPLILTFGSYSEFSCSSAEQPLSLFQAPDTLPKSIPLYRLTLELPAASIHSLFLTGTPSSPDTLFTKDTLPDHALSDSSAGIRFVNLSPGSGAVSINVRGQANGSETGSLAYKNITAFKNYPAMSVDTGYTFEFRDAASGVLLAICPINPATSPALTPYRNFTIALEGLSGSVTCPQAAYVINNY